MIPVKYLENGVVKTKQMPEWDLQDYVEWARDSLLNNLKITTIELNGTILHSSYSYDWSDDMPVLLNYAEVFVDGVGRVRLNSPEDFVQQAREWGGEFDKDVLFLDWRRNVWEWPLNSDQVAELFRMAAHDELKNVMRPPYPIKVLFSMHNSWKRILVPSIDGSLEDWTPEVAWLFRLPHNPHNGLHDPSLSPGEIVAKLKKELNMELSYEGVMLR